MDGELIVFGGLGKPSPMVDVARDTRLDRFLPDPLVRARLEARESRSREALEGVQALAWSTSVEKGAAAALADYRRRRCYRRVLSSHGPAMRMCQCGHHSCELCGMQAEAESD